ncbi:MAG: shikimate kinase [Candidatus Azobacteroides sp.]|nr:shikimate kinase [Candidatus Azobacteroides sp.]
MEANEKMNLYLIGYMGTGKTSVGKLLAKKLNRSFTDIDGFIENRYRQTIAAIFEEKGESGFREIERRALLEISGFENIVVSTGGGLPCFFDNMDLMNRTGITIYLRASVNDLVYRLNFNKQKRPLIKGKSPEELRDFVEESLKKRESFYNRAGFIADVPYCSTEKEMDQWAEDIIAQIS